MVFVTFLFLVLGGSLYVYASQKGVMLPMETLKDGTQAVITDKVFPTLALGEFGTLAGVFFLLGITASSYASADSALTALTTGFCIDFLNFDRRDEKEKKRLKLYTHIAFSLIFLLISLIMYQLPNKDLITQVLSVAAYTYGPLLGLFFFGILTKRSLRDKLVPIICLIVPAICYILDSNSKAWLGGYQFSHELLILNGLLTFGGLWLISFRKEAAETITFK
jgi:Na+/proline symporter